MKRDKKVKRKHYATKEKTSKSVLLIFAIVVPISICVAECLFNYWNLNTILNVYNNETVIYKDYSSVVQMDVINTGISVIAIAVSIWIGLNIYNNCRESELENKLKQLETENLKLAQERIKSLFLIEIRKTEESYEISAYFSRKFNEEDISEEILNRLISVEKDFCVCCRAYENRKMRSCSEYANKVLDKLNDIKIQKNRNKLLYIYKIIRKSDALFYKNMSSEKNIEELVKSIEMYKEVIEYFEEEEEEQTDQLRGYLENTVGYTYLVIYRIEKNVEDLENAIEQLETAVKHNPKGRYYQNLGACYEMKREYNKAIEQYKNALSSENCDNKVYNLLGSAYLKQVEHMMKIDKRFSQNGKLLSDYSNKDIDEEIEKKISSAYVWLSHATITTPFLLDAYYNFAKVNFYYWKLVDNDIEKQNSAKRYIEYAYYMDDKNDGVLFTYRNYFEIIGKIEEAWKYNIILKEKGKGDSKEADKVYSKYLNKNVEDQTNDMGLEKDCKKNICFKTRKGRLRNGKRLSR